MSETASIQRIDRLIIHEILNKLSRSIKGAGNLVLIERSYSNNM